MPNKNAAINSKNSDVICFCYATAVVPNHKKKRSISNAL